MTKTTVSIRARYSETDQMGVVHHAAYLPWLEVARTEYLRKRGVSYKALEEKGINMPVLKIEVEYLRPALYDDLLSVTARLEAASAVRFEFAYEVRRDDGATLLCRGKTYHAATGRDGRPRRVPEEIMRILGGDLAKS